MLRFLVLLGLLVVGWLRSSVEGRKFLRLVGGEGVRGGGGVGLGGGGLLLPRTIEQGLSLPCYMLEL